MTSQGDFYHFVPITFKTLCVSALRCTVNCPPNPVYSEHDPNAPCPLTVLKENINGPESWPTESITVAIWLYL